MSLWATDLIDDPALRARREKSSRIPDLIFGALLPLMALSINNIPVNELATLAMVGLALMRKPKFRLPAVVAVLLIALLVGLTLSAMLNGMDLPYRRLGHMVSWSLLIVTVAQGRINLMSLARGVGLGILVAVPLALPSISRGGYAGRLTGVFGDPNSAGMALVAIGPWAVGIVGKRLRIPIAIALVAAVILTYSRTSLLALALLIVWVAMSRRFSVWLTLAVLTPIALLMPPYLEQLRLSGPFESRGGSDLLRDRIAEAAAEKLAVTPWYGNGPGTATVTVQKLTFFLHNSYDAVRLEGGWLALFIVLALAGFSFFRAATGAQDQRHPWFEGALGASMICALSLGEVLFELPFAANLGALLLVGSVQRNATYDQSSFFDNRTDRERFTAQVNDDSFIAKLQNAPSRLGQQGQSYIDAPMETGGAIDVDRGRSLIDATRNPGSQPEERPADTLPLPRELP